MPFLQQLARDNARFGEIFKGSMSSIVKMTGRSYSDLKYLLVSVCRTAYVAYFASAPDPSIDMERVQSNIRGTKKSTYFIVLYCIIINMLLVHLLLCVYVYVFEC
jgi:hypothetical protein